MTEQKKITPIDGKIIPLADGNGNLPQEGKVVSLNTYWYQRQQDGDVKIEDVPAEEVTAVAGSEETPSAVRKK
jgi:hypothetical protein